MVSSSQSLKSGRRTKSLSGSLDRCSKNLPIFRRRSLILLLIYSHFIGKTDHFRELARVAATYETVLLRQIIFSSFQGKQLVLSNLELFIQPQITLVYEKKHTSLQLHCTAAITDPQRGVQTDVKCPTLSGIH